MKDDFQTLLESIGDQMQALVEKHGVETIELKASKAKDRPYHYGYTSGVVKGKLKITLTVTK